MTLQEFLNKYLGGSWGYPEGKYVGECLSICKLYIKEVFGIDPPPSGTNSAYGYWTNFPSPLGTKFEKVANTPDLIPEKGWIGIMEPWDSNPYGHIFIVADGSTTGICKNWAQNWTSRTFQLESNRYTHIVGFLKPKLPVNDEMTEEQKRILDFIGNRTEGDVRQAFGALADLPNVTKEIEALKASQKDLVSRIEQLEADAKANNELIVDYQSQLSSAKSRETKLQAELKAQADEKNQWKNRYEQALKDQVNKYTGWQLVRMGIQKLIIQSKK